MVFGSVVIAAKVLKEKSQICAVEFVLPEYFVPSIKTLRECLV